MYESMGDPNHQTEDMDERYGDAFRAQKDHMAEYFEIEYFEVMRNKSPELNMAYAIDQDDPNDIAVLTFRLDNLKMARQCIDPARHLNGKEEVNVGIMKS